MSKKEIQAVKPLEDDAKILEEEIIRFIDHNNEWIEVSFLSDGRIAINGKNRLNIEPRASNMIYIGSEK